MNSWLETQLMFLHLFNQQIFLVHQALFKVLGIWWWTQHTKPSWNLQLRRSALVEGHIWAGRGKGASPWGSSISLRTIWDPVITATAPAPPHSSSSRFCKSQAGNQNFQQVLQSIWYAGNADHTVQNTALEFPRAQSMSQVLKWFL